MVIWKYDLTCGFDIEKFVVPVGAKPLAVQLQDGPKLWMLVDPQAPRRTMRVGTYATGEDIDPGYTYVGTYQRYELVYHVFVL